MDVSVIIGVAAPDYERLPDQIRQLARQSTERDFEVVIGDNGGLLRLPDMPAEMPIIVVDASGMRGVAYARNFAVSNSSGRHLLFCDADDLVAPAWIEAHASALEHHDLTAGSFLNVRPDDKRRDAAIEGQWPSSDFSSRIRHHEGVPFATSANLGIQRRIFDRTGGYPTAYLRSQDVALSFALRRVGISPHFVSNAHVIKVVGRRSRSDAVRTEYRAGQSRVLLYREFHVGPRPVSLALRASLRAARATVDALLPRRPVSRPMTWEAAQLAGIISRTARRR